MKRLHLLILAGGLLAGAAFFLPYALANPAAGVFSAGKSIKEMLNYSLSYLGVLQVDRGRIILGYAASLLEPAGVILLLIGGLVALKLRRTGALCGLCGALFGLMPIVWLTTFLLAFYQALSYPASIANYGSLLRGFGSGYWLAIIGCVLGLVGALAVWLERPRLRMPMDQPQDRPALHIRPGALLTLGGGLVVTAGIFVVPFVSSIQKESLLSAFSKPYGFSFFWAVPLTLLLLVASGLVAFTGRKAAYLGSLIGGLVGLTFLLLILSPVYVGFEASFFEIYIGVGSWLLLIGSVLGLIGAALGLLERPASPIPAEAQVAHLPS